MDLIILMIAIILIVIWKKNFKSFVYFIGIAEILFRLLTYINDNLKIEALNNFVNEYIPGSIFDILSKYSNGLLLDVFSWLLIACFVVFEYYLIRVFIKNRR